MNKYFEVTHSRGQIGTCSIESLYAGNIGRDFTDAELVEEFQSLKFVELNDGLRLNKDYIESFRLVNVKEEI